MDDIMDMAHDIDDFVDAAGDRKISGATVSELGESMASLATIFKTINSSVEAANGGNPPPPIDSVTGSGKGDADASAIVSIGAWDKWIEDSDRQLQAAVEKEIDGATDYRAALRKHAINGK